MDVNNLRNKMSLFAFSGVYVHGYCFILYLMKEAFMELDFWEAKFIDVNGIDVVKLNCRNLAIKANQTE